MSCNIKPKNLAFSIVVFCVTALYSVVGGCQSIGETYFFHFWGQVSSNLTNEDKWKYSPLYWQPPTELLSSPFNITKNLHRLIKKKSSVSSIFSTFSAKLYVVIPLQAINFILTKEISVFFTVTVLKSKVILATPGWNEIKGQKASERR